MKIVPIATSKIYNNTNKKQGPANNPQQVTFKSITTTLAEANVFGVFAGALMSLSGILYAYFTLRNSDKTNNENSTKE